MSIELSELMQLMAGRKPVLTIGNLPRSVAAYLKAHPAIVYLRRRELIKILEKHTEIELDHLMHLTFAIEKGKYYSDPNRTNCVSSIYYNNDNEKAYVVGIKTALNGSEVWISTYHRSTRVKLERRYAQSQYLCGPKK
jgi:hypothetical protein